MNSRPTLLLDEQARIELWNQVIDAVEDYAKGIREVPVSSQVDQEKIRSILQPFDFETGHDPSEVVDFVVEGLLRYQVHTRHPLYFGLFTPAPATMGIFGDTLAAAFNPQLASWRQSPLPAEIERHLVLAFAKRFGYDPSETDGTFTSGGAEANHTAILTALVHRFPSFATSGVRSLDSQPLFYVSRHAHGSLFKAARFCGLGTNAVRQIAVDASFQLDPESLAVQISKDRRAGFEPFMVIATAGTTSAGAVDPIEAIADVAATEGLWFHVDAAWGGASCMVPELRPLLLGIDRADSITFDAHKWLSAPMAAGMFLTCHKDILDRACRVTTDYMPSKSGTSRVDSYAHSMQWSRRFTGLKVFLALAVTGWSGYESVLRHQVAMGDLLRRKLESSSWKVVNKTVLPVVCFNDAKIRQGQSANYLESIERHVVASGKAWISTTRLDENTPVLRACITNYGTESADIMALVECLAEARQKCLAR